MGVACIRLCQQEPFDYIYRGLKYSLVPDYIVLSLTLFFKYLDQSFTELQEVNFLNSCTNEKAWSLALRGWFFLHLIELFKEVLAVPPLFLQESGHSSGMKFGRRLC